MLRSFAEAPMRNRREWLFGSVAALLAASGLSAEAGPGAVVVTYYFLPG
jgi:hypothetical protein